MAATTQAVSLRTQQPVQFIDRSGRTYLVLYTAGPFTGRFTIHVRAGQSYAGVIRPAVARRHTIRLNQTVRARLLSSSRHEVTVHLDGTLVSARRFADIHIQVGRGNSERVIRTKAGGTRRLTAVLRSLVLALARNRLIALAKHFEPALRGGLSLQAFAHQLGLQHVHVTRVDTLGSGRALALQDGNPGWAQPITLTATGRHPLHANLVLEQIGRHWWLIGST